MSRRVLVGFIVVNVIVSLLVALAIISYDRANRPDELREGPTQIVILTLTPLPGYVLQPAEYQSTIDTQQLTITALAQQPPVVTVVATLTEDEGGIPMPEITAVATINPELLPDFPTELPPGQPTSTLETDGCLRHIVQAGDVIISIADQYNVYPGDVLVANDLDDDHILQIGEVLIIPVAGCAVLYTPTPELTPTNTPFALDQTAPTPLPQSIINAQVEIADVKFWGDVNSEEVEIRNLSNVINLQGWQLVSERGDTFVFPEFRMQQGSPVRIFSRQGQNTPAALYWNRETPVWAEGEMITLLDANGQVQATFLIGETLPLFQEVTPTLSP